MRLDSSGLCAARATDCALTETHTHSEKQRVPSWTDRVLYLGMRDESVRSVEQYQSHPEVTMSDHKPVSAMLHVSVRCFVSPSLSLDGC